jgi:APA family basic amino acid/polyamine antiporter
MLPSAGGPYVYLREAFGRLPAFLFGWTEFLVIRTGSIATLAAAFAMNFVLVFADPFGMKPGVWQTLAAIAAIVTLTTINVVGTRLGGWVQVAGTLLKVLALVSMIILPFWLGKIDPKLLTPIGSKSYDLELFSAMMLAMYSVLWTYDGWVNAASLAEEIKDPGRNIPRALILGLLALIAIYLGMTLVYHLVLPLNEIRESTGIISVDFMRKLIGDRGPTLIAVVIMCSTFITLNGNALSGPRAYFAMARDGLFPRSLCKINPRLQTPANAIIAQAVWAVLLIVAASAFLLIDPPAFVPTLKSARPPLWHSAWQELHKKPLYDIMYTYVIFGGTIFYGLAILSVFVLRVKRPDLSRPYRTWGYPVTPLLYTVASLFLLGSMLYNTFAESIAGLAIVAAGLPAYWFFSRSRVLDAS